MKKKRMLIQTKNTNLFYLIKSTTFANNENSSSKTYADNLRFTQWFDPDERCGSLSVDLFGF
jgi:hypothetical protein